MKTVSVLTIAGSMMLGLLGSDALITIVAAQESGNIVIVNRDGERVTTPKLQLVQPGADDEQDKAATGAAEGQIKVKGQLRNQEGKWVVKDAEGNEQELDVQGAQSIVINQSVESVDENGEKKTKRVGKAIIVGPDGKRHEIELGGSLFAGGTELNFPGFSGIMRAERVKNSYMIGVNCKPVGAAMRAQLDLDADVGLLVLNVSKDSPAKAAGLQEHDILMFADDTQLAKQSDLAEVVQRAGKEKGKVSLTALRAGKEIGIDVSPIERPESTMVQGVPNLFNGFPDVDGQDFNMQFRQMGPGLIVGGDLEGDFQIEFENEMKQMEARMNALREQMEQQLQKQLKENDKD